MKWLALVCVLLAVHPLGAWARDKPRAKFLLAVLVAFLPFYAVDINLVSYEAYRGDTRGLELSLADFVAYSLYVAVKPPVGPQPFAWIRRAYLVIAIASIAMAPIPLFAAFGVFKLVRCYFLFASVHRASRGGGLGPAFVWGLSLGITYAAGVALWQRYGLGMMQAPGPFAHQNGLAMAGNMVFPSALALSLAGRGGRTAIVAIVASALAVVLTLSRGGMIMFCVAGSIVWVGSVARRRTLHKAKWVGLMLVAALAVLAKSWDTILERFGHAAASSEEAREYFEEASSLILHDHPLGIGMNQYSHVLEHSGYGERLGMDPNDCSGIVHNIYWLTATELGYQGILVFVALLAAPLLLAARAAVRDRTIVGDWMLGIAASLFVTYLQGKLEWALRMTVIAQILWILFALVASHAPGRRNGGKRA